MALLIALLVLVASPVMAQSQQDDLTVGVKVGTVYPGCVYIDDSFCFDTDVNYSLGGFVDYALAPRLSGGLFVDLVGVSGEATDTEMLFDAGFTLKASIELPRHRLRVRPGFGIGYGAISVADESVRFLTVRVPVEVLLVKDSGGTYGVELAVYAGPWGGSAESDVVFGPGAMLRGVFTF